MPSPMTVPGLTAQFLPDGTPVSNIGQQGGSPGFLDQMSTWAAKLGLGLGSPMGGTDPSSAVIHPGGPTTVDHSDHDGVDGDTRLPNAHPLSSSSLDVSNIGTAHDASSGAGAIQRTIADNMAIQMLMQGIEEGKPFRSPRPTDQIPQLMSDIAEGHPGRSPRKPKAPAQNYAFDKSRVMEPSGKPYYLDQAEATSPPPAKY